MNKQVFTVDMKRLVILLMPVKWRQPTFIAWLGSLVVPVQMIYSSFMNNRAANLYNLAHNSQVCYLRKVLNDVFDPDLRRIRITDGQKHDPKYIYTRGEQRPKYLGTMFLRRREDYISDGIDFRVIIPIGFALQPVQHQMKATIDFYKLASKRYSIEYDE